MSQYICDDMWRVILEYSYNYESIAYVSKLFLETVVAEHVKHNEYVNDFYINTLIIGRQSKECMDGVLCTTTNGHLFMAIIDAYPEIWTKRMHIKNMVSSDWIYNAFKMLYNKKIIDPLYLMNIVNIIMVYYRNIASRVFIDIIGIDTIIKSLCSNTNNIRYCHIYHIINELPSGNIDIVNMVDNEYIFFQYISTGVSSFNGAIDTKIAMMLNRPTCLNHYITGQSCISRIVNYLFRTFEKRWVFGKIIEKRMVQMHDILNVVSPRYYDYDYIKNHTLQCPPYTRSKIIDRMAYTRKIDPEYLIKSRMFYKIMRKHPRLADNRVYEEIFNHRSLCHDHELCYYIECADNQYLPYDVVLTRILSYNINTRLRDDHPFHKQKIYKMYMSHHFPKIVSEHTMKIVIDMCNSIDTLECIYNNLSADNENSDITHYIVSKMESLQ